ncbi:MAG: tyrosine-type recombinase/integrase [Clostridia bacterium]|nr:tyrosine-type recombinase/integrase [Clostridia bacterium]
MPQLIKDFAAYKLTIQACSSKTVDEYLSDLRLFFKYIFARRSGISLFSDEFDRIDLTSLDNDFICSVTTEEIYEFFIYLSNERRNGACAKSRKLSAIKSFFKFLCQKKHLMEKNPAIDMEGPKKRHSLPKFLSMEESLLLLEAVENDTESKTKERDYAIITLFLNCGMRLSELCGINLSDMDRELRSLRVVGKGNKERIVYLNDACRDALSKYLIIRKSEKYSKINTNALFISKQYKRISNKTVQWLVYKYLALAGLEYKHFSTHKLRHTAATLMYQTGKVDVRVLKEILGHEQLNTTQIYTHVSNKGMQDAMDNNPLAGIKQKKKPE